VRPRLRTQRQHSQRPGRRQRVLERPLRARRPLQLSQRSDAGSAVLPEPDADAPRSGALPQLDPHGADTGLLPQHHALGADAGLLSQRVPHEPDPGVLPERVALGSHPGFVPEPDTLVARAGLLPEHPSVARSRGRSLPGIRFAGTDRERNRHLHVPRDHNDDSARRVVDDVQPGRRALQRNRHRDHRLRRRHPRRRWSMQQRGDEDHDGHVQQAGARPDDHRRKRLRRRPSI